MYKSKQLPHPWIKIIHSYTHTMDEKWIFLLIINRDTSENLYRRLVEIEKSSPPPGPPTLKSSISMEGSQCKGKLGTSNNECSKGQRGCKLKHI